MLENAEYDLDLSIPPRVIVDAGANIGLTSVFYANKYPQARVLAIEPETSNYEILEKNAAPYPNITCIRRALWRSDTAVTIADPGSGHWGFQTVEEAGKTRSSEVEGITVNSLMARFAIDYIDFFRIDIEGAEHEVFESSSPWIEKVGVIAIELHDRLKTGCSRSVYLATKNFHWEIRRGETIFLGREEFAVKEVAQLSVLAGTSNTSLRRVRGRRPCTIVSAI
jgi:FkbM family methyltransferase